MTSLKEARVNDKDKRKAAKLGYIVNNRQIEAPEEEISIEKPKKKKPKKEA